MNVNGADLPRLLDRRIATVASEYLQSFRVVVVHGPRQAGKTTLMRMLAARHGGELRNLDDDAMAGAARQDPVGFVQASARPLFLDEVQRGGDVLVRAVKSRVDASNQPGQFVLAGSLQFLTAPTLVESLAGRAAVLEVWPFSEAELRGTNGGLLERLLSGGEVADGRTYDLERLDYLDLVVRGGFPEVNRLRSARARSVWFRNYVAAVVQRDIREMARVREPSAADAVLRGIAALSSQTLVTSTIAARADLPRATVDRYIGLLEAVLLVRRLPPWSRNVLRRAVARPKIHLVDSGLASNLVGATTQELATPTSTMVGQLVETFVVNEIAKQASWSPLDLRLFHYRDGKGDREVDLVIEDERGRVVAVEIKAAASVSDRDFRHLRSLRRDLGDDLVHGLVVYLGSHTLSFGDGLTAVPLAALWA